MQVLVEFNGIARILSGAQQHLLTLEDTATFRDVLHHLGAAYPPLLGQVLTADGGALIGSNMLNRNGKEMIRPEALDTSPHDGDRLILMSIMAGG